MYAAHSASGYARSTLVGNVPPAPAAARAKAVALGPPWAPRRPCPQRSHRGGHRRLWAWRLALSSAWTPTATKAAHSRAAVVPRSLTRVTSSEESAAW